MDVLLVLIKTIVMNAIQIIQLNKEIASVQKENIHLIEQTVLVVFYKDVKIAQVKQFVKLVFKVLN